MDRTALDGIWTLTAVSPRKGKGIQEGLEIEMGIPGDVHSALTDAGLMDDPYTSSDEDDGWIPLSDWEIRRSFRSDGGHSILWAEGVDGTGFVRINGMEAGKLSPGCGRSIIDISQFVKDGENSIAISFPGSRGEWTEPMRGDERKHGEGLVPVGIHSGIGILSDPAFILLSADPEAVMDDGRWIVRISIEGEAYRPVDIGLSAEVNHIRTESTAHAEPGHVKLSFDADPGAVMLWWPRGRGQQPVYHISIKAGGWEEGKDIGFRTASIGRDGHTEINGSGVFLKGACWMAEDILPARTDRARAAHIVRSAAEANLNAIWVKGCIGPDELYSAADRAGIMIIQDRIDGKAGKRLCSHPSLLAVAGSEEEGFIDIPDNSMAPYREGIITAYGIPSLPSERMLRSFAGTPFSISSSSIDAHGGVGEILRTVAGRYRFPTSLDRLIYLSQLEAEQQASCTYYRARIEGKCSGTFLSSLADRWPCISPSAIDHSGRWKLMQYGIRLYSSPLAPLLIRDGEKACIYMVNDTPQREKAEMSVKIRTFSGSKKEAREYSITAPAFSVSKVAEIPLQRFQRGECFMYVKMATKDILRERTLLLDMPKRLRLEDPKLSYEISQAGPRSIAIKLKAEKPAFFVSLISEDIPGIFSDNMISVRPSAEKCVIFQTEEEADESAFRAGFRIFDLYSAMG